MQKVFIVEDDVSLCEEVCTLLDRNGYETDVARDFARVAEAVIDASPDLVLLDLTLPSIDGQVVCREIRRRSDVPIIVMTSRDNDLDELLALNTGADDFIAKPFNPRVFLAHIAAHLRRVGENSFSQTITHAGVELDAARGTVFYEGAAADLTRNEILLLSVLMRQAGTIVSRAHLADELWQTDEFVDDNTLTVNITRLRASLASIGVPDDFLQTKRGMGYVIA